MARRFYSVSRCAPNDIKVKLLRLLKFGRDSSTGRGFQRPRVGREVACGGREVAVATTAPDGARNEAGISDGHSAGVEVPADATEGVGRTDHWRSGRRRPRKGRPTETECGRACGREPRGGSAGRSVLNIFFRHFGACWRPRTVFLVQRSFKWPC